MAEQSFADQLAWIRADEQRWEGTFDPSWAQGRATFGGVQTALALQAMAALVPPERRARAVTTTFLGPVSPAPAALEARVLRAGRALTSATAELWQGGSLRATFSASFGEDRPSAVQVQPDRRPAVPPPDAAPEQPYLDGVTPTFTQHFAYRWTHDSYPFTGSDTAVVGGWVRHRTAAPWVAGAAVGLLDAWPAPVLPLLRGPAPASTASWTAYLIDLPAAVSPEDWWWFEADARWAGGGYATTQGRLFAPDGRLAAHMEQLVVVFGG